MNIRQKCEKCGSTYPCNTFEVKQSVKQPTTLLIKSPSEYKQVVNRRTCCYACNCYYCRFKIVSTL